MIVLRELYLMLLVVAGAAATFVLSVSLGVFVRQLAPGRVGRGRATRALRRCLPRLIAPPLAAGGDVALILIAGWRTRAGIVLACEIAAASFDNSAKGIADTIAVMYAVVCAFWLDDLVTGGSRRRRRLRRVLGRVRERAGRLVVDPEPAPA